MHVETGVEDVSLADDDSSPTMRISDSNETAVDGSPPLVDERSKKEQLKHELKTLRYIRSAQGKMMDPSSGILSVILYISEVRNDVRFILRGGEHKDFVEHHMKCTRKPVMTIFLMLLCVGGFIFSIQQNDWVFESPRRNFTLGPSFETLLDIGSVSTSKLVDDREWWRLIVAPFLHGGVLHLLVNLLLMYFVGGAIETSVGRATTLLVFIIAAVSAFVCSALFSPFSSSVGASGGICGWLGLGLYTAILQRSWFAGTKLRKVVAFTFLELSLLLVVGLLPWFDNFAHAAGLVYGVLLGLCLVERESLRTRHTFVTLYQHGKRMLLGFSLLLCSISSTVLYLYSCESNADLPCRQCYRYFTCVIESLCDPCLVASALLTDKDNGSFQVELYCPYGETAHFETWNDALDPVAVCSVYCATY